MQTKEAESGPRGSNEDVYAETTYHIHGEKLIWAKAFEVTSELWENHRSWKLPQVQLGLSWMKRRATKIEQNECCVEHIHVVVQFDIWYNLNLNQYNMFWTRLLVQFGFEPVHNGFVHFIGYKTGAGLITGRRHYIPCRIYRVGSTHHPSGQTKWISPHLWR